MNDYNNIEKKTTAEGEIEGQMKNGILNGKGRIRYKNGAIYEGEFKEGHFHGKGIYKYSNGEIYNGDWVQDKR